MYGKSVLLKNLEPTILIKCSLYIERNIYAYIRTYNIYIYTVPLAVIYSI